MQETMKNTMNAAVLHKPLSIAVEQVPIPAPKPDEALVRVECIGICGSDIHYYEHGRIGRYVVERPIILGHELAGDVVAVGAEVRDIQVGQRVAVEPGIPCGRCPACKSGRYNLCPDVQFMATPPVDGAWAEYVAVRSDFLHPLPDSLSYEEGALLEPLSVGMHAMMRGRVGPGDTVLISGLGPIGALATAAAKIHGATTIIGTDLVPFRRDAALQLGADAVMSPADPGFQEWLDEWTGGRGPLVVIETSGAPRAVTSTVEYVQQGGRIVLIGLPAMDAIPLNIPMLVDKEVDVLGVFRYANTYPRAIAALTKQHRQTGASAVGDSGFDSRAAVDANLGSGNVTGASGDSGSIPSSRSADGELGIRSIITHRFDLKDIREACELARTDKEHTLKIMIYPNGVSEK